MYHGLLVTNAVRTRCRKTDSCKLYIKMTQSSAVNTSAATELQETCYHN